MKNLFLLILLVMGFSGVFAIDEKDLDAQMHGTQEAPNTEMFSRLRNVQVYDIFVTTEDNEDVHLQIYAEYFQDAKDL